MSTIMDPSDLSLSKHDLAQWLYKHDKTTTLHSKLTRGQLATKVQEAQPHLFPNPETDAPALRVGDLNDQPAAPEDRKPFVGIDVHARMPSSSNTGLTSPASTSIAADTAPPRKAKRVTLKSPTSFCYKTAEGASVPADSRPAFKAKRISSDDHGAATALNKKRKKPMQNVIQDQMLNVPNSAGISTSTSTPVASSTPQDAKDKRRATESKVLQEPSILPSLDSEAVTKSKKSKNKTTSTILTNQLISLGPETVNPATPTSHQFEADLIQFPDLDLFETANPIVGRKIDPIDSNPSLHLGSKGPVLSGTDYFQSQRKKEEQVADLEERVAAIEEMSQISVTVQTRLDFLVVEVERLQTKLKLARDEIKDHDKAIDDHEKVLTSLLSVDNDDSRDGSEVSIGSVSD